MYSKIINKQRVLDTARVSMREKQRRTSNIMAIAAPPEKKFDPNEFDWVQLRKDFGDIKMETKQEKLMRKLKENPLVPIGCFATLGALSAGLWQFRKGNQRNSQLMMRARIIAQGFTVFALIIGVGASLGKKM